MDSLSKKANKVLSEDSSLFFKELLELNGSSAGARPKVLVGIDEAKKRIINGVGDLEGDFNHWIVKFTNTFDGKDGGAIEYVYSQMAKMAGIEMTETHLFPAKIGAGYFGTRRFDRIGNKRLHMHTVCGLLHSDFRVPALDYEDIMNLAFYLTRNAQEVKKVYRLAVFNVLTHNKDDHSKNFSFLMDKNGEWRFSPAYDLTFSSGLHGEQSMMVMRNGQPTEKDLLKLRGLFVKNKEANDIIEQTKEVIQKWKTLASNAGVSKTKMNEIGRKILTI